MTRRISLDIGFDRESLDKPRRSDEAPLSCGVTVPGRTGNPIHLARSLKRGDRVLFTLYDLTDADRKTSPVDSLSLKIQFGAARMQGDDTPAARSIYDTFEIFPGSKSPEHSTVFGGIFPSWNVHVPAKEGPRYPENQLVPDKTRGPAASVVFENKGHYFFTLFLKVGWRQGDERVIRIYHIDPEIILSNNGKPPKPPVPPDGD